MKMEMMDQYVLGCFIAFFLGFLLLQRFNKNGDKKIKKQAPRGGIERSQNNVVCTPDGPPDVVIVGAGVAGSALAYSLAKVCACVCVFGSLHSKQLLDVITSS